MARGIAEYKGCALDQLFSSNVQNYVSHSRSLLPREILEQIPGRTSRECPKGTYLEEPSREPTRRSP